MLSRFLQIDTRAGDPIPVGDTTILPLARSLRLRLPGRWGGLIWNRPASVVVQTADGQEYTLPVRDVTRQVQFALIGGGLMGVIFVWLLTRRNK